MSTSTFGTMVWLTGKKKKPCGNENKRLNGPWSDLKLRFAAISKWPIKGTSANLFAFLFRSLLLKKGSSGLATFASLFLRLLEVLLAFFVSALLGSCVRSPIPRRWIAKHIPCLPVPRGKPKWSESGILSKSGRLLSESQLVTVVEAGLIVESYVRLISIVERAAFLVTWRTDAAQAAAAIPLAFSGWPGPVLPWTLRPVGPKNRGGQLLPVCLSGSSRVFGGPPRPISHISSPAKLNRRHLGKGRSLMIDATLQSRIVQRRLTSSLLLHPQATAPLPLVHLFSVLSLPLSTKKPQKPNGELPCGSGPLHPLR